MDTISIWSHDNFDTLTKNIIVCLEEANKRIENFIKMYLQCPPITSQ
jgi:hypothetical protein